MVSNNKTTIDDILLEYYWAVHGDNARRILQIELMSGHIQIDCPVCKEFTDEVCRRVEAQLINDDSY